MKKKEKDFDAMQFIRQRRDELADLYWQDKGKYLAELKKIREKLESSQLAPKELTRKIPKAS